MDIHDKAKMNKRRRGSRRKCGEGCSKVISIVRTTVTKPDGTVEIKVDGVTLVSSKQVG